jgi:hypothetical protein
MDIKTTKDVEGLIGLANNKRIAKINKEISRLNYLPAMLLVFTLLPVLIVYLNNHELSPLMLATSFAVSICVTGQGAMRKADLLHEVTEIKSKGL